jgi:hypothetical protein
MIFNKVLDNEIEKAIILRDGKPTFLLMEFGKYEKIMAEYEKLKAKAQKEKKTKQTTSQPPQNKPQIVSTTMEISPTIPPSNIERNISTKSKPKEEVKQDIPKDEVVEELSEKDEISNAMKSIEGMNFDDDMQKAAKEKITLRIKKAREERARILAQEASLQDKEDLKEELILQQQLNEVKKQKDRELKEFWD